MSTEPNLQTALNQQVAGRILTYLLGSRNPRESLCPHVDSQCPALGEKAISGLASRIDWLICK